MNTERWVILSMLAAALAAAPGLRAEPPGIAAGKEKAGACAGCHGGDGNSPAPTFPKLAAQHSSYIVKQLQAFREGVRNDPMMSAIAQSLSDEDSSQIADYFNAQKISENPMPVPPSDDGEDEADESAKPAISPEQALKDLLAKGGDLYRNGDREREISACIACHGPYGEGNKPAAFPALKGQHADYLIKTLGDFKSGARSKNPENPMYMIAKKMTEEQIKAVSYHISVMK